MQIRISALVASITVSLVLAVPTAGVAAAPRHHRPPRHHRIRLPKDYAAWSHVAVCEEGGWFAPGGNYPDALGIDATNYAQFGGHPDYGHIGLAARVAEIRVADRLIRYYHVGIPDRGGCAAW